MSDEMKKEITKIAGMGIVGAITMPLTMVPNMAPHMNVGQIILAVIGFAILGILVFVGLLYGFPVVGGYIMKPLKVAGKSFGEMLGAMFKDLFDGGIPIWPIIKLSFALTACIMVVFIAWPIGDFLAVKALVESNNGRSRTTGIPGKGSGGWGSETPKGNGGWDSGALGSGGSGWDNNPTSGGSGDWGGTPRLPKGKTGLLDKLSRNKPKQRDVPPPGNSSGGW